MSADAGARATPGNFELREEFGNAEANMRFLAEVRAIAPGVRLLEIGSGRGALLHYLIERGMAAQGVEVSADQITESRRRFGALPLHKVAGAALPFPEASFDIVLSFDVFEHIADTDAHLAEVRRVLAPGGRYLLQTPNKWTNTVFETIRWKSLTSWRADHCALHTYGQLQRRLAQHGFAARFYDIPVVTEFFLRKLKHYLGPPGPWLARLVNPDKLPLRLRTNFYVEATRK